jgi:hypothetical protein
MYVHGVISIIQEGPKQFISLNSLPPLILSAPSILLDLVGETFHRPHQCVSVLNDILLHGIIEIGAKTRKSKDSDTFIETVEQLRSRGLLINRIVDFSSFSTNDVFNVERRISNLQLVRKRIQKEDSTIQSPTESKSPPPSTSIKTSCVTIDWNGVATFLRDRFVIEASDSFFGPNYTQLITSLLNDSRGSDYSTHRNMSNCSEEELRDLSLSFPSITVENLINAASDGSHQKSVRDKLDSICHSPLAILREKELGASYEITVPFALRSLQLHYIEMFCEQTLSPYHRRCFNRIRSLKVAEARQIEMGALLSEKDARSSMYSLCKLGFVQMQSIPRSATDRMVSARSLFVWRYVEEAALEAYCGIIGEHARRFLARIQALNEECEANERKLSGDRTAVKMNEKRERQLCGFNAGYAEALRIFLLFSEI